MGKSCLTPEQVERLRAMRRRAPGGPDYLKGTQYEKDREADKGHVRRRELERYAQEQERKAARDFAEAEQLRRQYYDAFGL
ncbi:MAG: hypothetical protein E6Y86_06090 [Slackia sp.]|uniref:hypothetical protein n=1 Tax=uncultured Slackia sp. TaxID=665903 RepID=UPI002805CD0F|nr:hypothetical protein [uncultured Slackia sp.]MDU6011599.1 hypothetical protein [Slackia sp.]